MSCKMDLKQEAMSIATTQEVRSTVMSITVERKAGVILGVMVNPTVAAIQTMTVMETIEEVEATGVAHLQLGIEIELLQKMKEASHLASLKPPCFPE